MSTILDLRDDCISRLPPDRARKYRDTEANIYFLSLALCGEVGELANMMKKHWRGDLVPNEQIIEELADIRVYLELLAKCYGIAGYKLDLAVAKKFEKVVQRYAS